MKMDNTRSFEVKVGMFILIGVAILSVIIFSIGDINISKNGYNITFKFNFASGILPSAPVRLAGVNVGQIQSVNIAYSDKDKKSCAEVHAWIREGVRIENDAKATINTLGLLGEKYLEIYPGTPGNPVLKNGEIITGHDPVIMEKLTENLVTMSDSATVIVKRLRDGEGAIGKLLTKDTVYTDFESMMSNFKDFSVDLKTTGTNFKEFSEDLKMHPWKLLAKPK
jgi:phospholipid/cholesterol/gamma-HCH transport system substrate-binding protein